MPGWPAGVSRSYFVAGWDTSMGHDFNPLWLVSRIFVGGDFGVSPVGSGAAGNGSDIPTLNLFDGGGNTLTVGMELQNTFVPEPSTTALLAFATGIILFRIHRGGQFSMLPSQCHDDIAAHV